MRNAAIIIGLLSLATCLPAQQTADGPTDEKAQKTYQSALRDLQDHRKAIALDGFKKADKQDGGHCRACHERMVTFGIELQEWKTAELGATEMVAEAKDNKAAALAHYGFGRVLLNEGRAKHKEDIFSRAHEELGKALGIYANFPDALYVDGLVLAYLQQDDAAKGRFQQYVKMVPENTPDRQRALRYIGRPELARARMAPPFTVTTVDGQHLSLDDLQGKVVLIDFWATWCPACREALPHIHEIAKKFQGEPLAILSVSLDEDEHVWKDFLAKKEMTWPQYRDGSLSGPLSKMFSVHAIPSTFTIDADGVLQDAQVGDAEIEGKLKKLIAQARKLQAEKARPQ